MGNDSTRLCFLILHLSVPFLNLNPVIGRGGACSFWGAGQGATTRNGATAQGGAVSSAGRCDPATACECPGIHKRSRGIPAAARSPIRGAPRATLWGAPIPRSCNAAMCRKKCAILLVTTHRKDEGQVPKKASICQVFELKNECHRPCLWSTAGFRLNHLS